MPFPALQLSAAFAKIFPKDSSLNKLLLALFFGLGLLGILNHAMWRDEMTIWLIVRDSQSWGELLQTIRYEPHPVLWYFCVAILQRLTRNPLSMQLFHLMIGVSVAYLILTKSPFTRLQKGLLIFGYLPFYEYLLISRNYSLGLLFGLGVCTLWETRKQTYLGLAILLFLMANCNVYSLFIAVALGLTLGLERLQHNWFNYQTQASLQNTYVSLIIFLSGILTSVAFLIPPSDNLEHGGLNDGWTFTFDLRHLFTTLARVWNSYVAVITAGDSKYYSVLICGLLALALLGFTIGVLLKKPLVLFFYSVATAEILLFTYVKFLGAQRHFGHLFIVFILALWLSFCYENSNLIVRLNRKFMQWFNVSQFYKKALIMLLLYAQLAAGIAAYTRDFMIPYSASRATARYIQKEGLNHLFIVGSQDVAVSPLSGYLKRKIYYPERQNLGSFILFNDSRKEVNEEEVLRQVESLVETHETILLILNYPLTAAKEGLKTEFIARFDKGLIYNEKYNLYRVQKNNN